MWRDRIMTAEKANDFQGVERRKKSRRKCPYPDDCPINSKQEYLVEEVASLKSDVSDLTKSVKEIVDIFEESKHVVSFIKKASSFVRWLSATVIAVAGIWALVSHVFKK